MKNLLSVKNIKLIFALVIIAGVVWLAYGAADPYRGLVTQGNIAIDDELRTQLEQQLATYQAALEAQLSTEDQPELDLFLLVANRAKTLGDYVTARETYEAYFQWNNINPVAWNNYGTVLLKMEDYEAARRAYGRAIELSPDLEEYYRDYVGVLEILGETEEIGQVYEFALENIDRTHSLMVAMAQYYESIDDCQRAIEHYKVAATLAEGDELIASIEADLQELEQTCKE